MNELIAKITSDSSVAIRSHNPQESLSQNLYAINWFNASPAWLYHLYNKLASRSVIKVGGRPLFKANVTESLLSDKGKRQILLVVKYPDGNAFKKLLESTYFKLVSVLRIMAVKRFTFSFTKPIGDIKIEQRYACYALHHFNNRDLDTLLPRIRTELEDIDIIYAGSTFAHLYRQTKGKKEVLLKNVVDRLVIFGSSSEERLKKVLQSDRYLSHYDKQAPGYISLINRIF